MSLTKIGSIGINTGIQFAGVTTVTTLKVGSGVTVSSDGDVFFTGIATGNGSGLTNLPAANLTGTLPAISGANLTNLDASDLASGTVPTARLGSGTASSSTFLRGDSTFQTVSTDLVNDSSPQLSANLDTNGQNILFGDSASSSDDRLKFGASTDLSIYHDGSNSYIVDSGTGDLLIGGDSVSIVNAAASEFKAKFISDGAVELYHNNAKKFETTTNGITVGSITIDSAYDYIAIPDDGQLRLGTGEDLRLYHNASDSFIKNNTGNLEILTNEFRLRTVDAGKTFMMASVNAEVQLWYNNSEKFRTTTDGILVTGKVLAKATQEPQIELQDSDSGHTGAGAETGIRFRDGAGTLQSDIGHYDSSSSNFKINTAINADIQFSTNNTSRMAIGANGFVPSADNSYDLGASSYRWRNVYSGDLNLSNEGSANDVDGTWGSYTIQEGESDLFLINKRSGKKYKFNLTEVS